MCLGVPMTVLETNGVSALCERRGERRQVSVMLLDHPPVGAQLLVFIDTAIRLLDADEALQIDNAIDGLQAACSGQDFDHLFADLIDREPELPAHLRQD